ncbi:MAG: LEA type 2 family protein [Bacteroidales bacterium]|nr:LEA type 2 family protein [Bacteroidales bacterium]
MTRRFSIMALVAVIMIAFSGCKAISGLTNFSKCDFDFNSVSDVSLCDINVGSKTGLTDFGLQDALKIANAFAAKSFPLSLNVNVDVKNPNQTTARLDGFEYILWIDDMRMTSGSMTKQLIVTGNQTAVMPVNLTFDIYELMAKNGKDKLVSLACGLACTDSAKSRVKLSIKPYFTIGNTTMRFPAYITIGGNRLMPD